jgi:hypothetical protein
VVHANAIPPVQPHRADVAEIVAAMSAELELVTDVLSDTIHEHLHELDDDLRAMTGQSVRANLGLIVTMLREGNAPANAVAPEEARAYVREYVRRGIGLDVLQRAYRTAQAALSRLVLDRLRAKTDDPDHLVELVGFFNDFLFGWVEELERQLLDVYLREREQWVRSAAAVRAAEVRALLDGSRADVPAASRRLGYELEREHLAYVIWSADDEADGGDRHAVFGEMERLAAAAAEALGAHGALTVPLGRHLACWAGLPPGADTARLASLDGSAQLRIALGTPGAGVEGFCRSHREAMLARRVARLGRGRGASTPFADVSLDALATHDVDEARRFVARELGPLAADDDAARRMSATLRVFLEEGSSYVRAGRRLAVHANTIAYRVHRAEELLGHPVAERQLELRVALRLARLVRDPQPPS